MGIPWFVREPPRRDPRGGDVYHYAAYETSVLKQSGGALRRLTPEDEIDDLLRREVFVDLFKVVRQGIRASRPGELPAR